MLLARVCGGFHYAGLGGRLINAATRIARLARHASAAIASIRTLAVTAPRPIGMIFADPAGVVAN
jgi:hypothetical protein